MPRYLDPKNDLVFKKIFGQHPRLLKSFLNSVLPLPQDCVIESLTYLAPENVPELAMLKNSIVDVRCLDNHGRNFIVEMQLQWTGDFIKRMLFNTAATYVRQLEKGKKYQHLSPVYGLALLDDVFSEEEKWFHHFRMADAHNSSKNLDDIQLVLIELPKFKPNNITGKRLMVLWLRFLKEIKDGSETVDPSLFEVEEIKEALHLLEVASYNKAELLAYDQQWDFVSSERTLISGKLKEGFAKGLAEGRTEGRAAGIAEGLAEGLAAGIAEGHAEGLAKAKEELIINMHRSGIALSQIAQIAQLSEKEVSSILHEK